MNLNPELLRELREQNILLQHYQKTAALLQNDMVQKVKRATGLPGDTFHLDLEQGTVTDAAIQPE